MASRCTGQPPPPTGQRQRPRFRLERGQAAPSSSTQQHLNHIQISQSAEHDLLDAYRFYNAQQPGIGDHFLDCLSADIDSLGHYAGVHRIAFGLAHQMLAKRFPYAIYYQLQGSTVTVVAVLDCRQDPKNAATKLRRQYRKK